MYSACHESTYWAEILDRFAPTGLVFSRELAKCIPAYSAAR